MDFHVRLIFVNLSLVVWLLPPGPEPPADEHAILTNGETVAGTLDTDPSDGIVFRSSDSTIVWPASTIRKIVRGRTTQITPGTSPAHRVILWGDESLSGSVQSLDGDGVHLITPAGESVQVPRYLVAKIEHFQGDAVIFRDDFELEEFPRRLSGQAQRSSDKSASGHWSLRLSKPGDSLEYRLPDPIGSGWFEVKFFDSSVVQAGMEWLCEFEFASPSGTRTMQVLLGLDEDSYGLATPQGPSLPVQHLARRAGWNRLAVRYGPNRTAVLLDEAVLTHVPLSLGHLRSVRFLVQPIESKGGTADDVADSSLYVDDLQIAETIGFATDWQSAPNQDDLWFTLGDQLYGQIESATNREVTIRGEFGLYSLPWRQLQAVHFASRPCPPKLIEGQRVRVQFCGAAAPDVRALDSEVLEGILRELREDRLRIEHPHIGSITIRRSQLRELEFLSSGGWLAIDSGFHHFGDQVNARFQVPHPEGSERSWRFSLGHVPAQSFLVLHVHDMEAMAPGGEFSKKLEDDELRTYVTINGQQLVPRGLNHLLPPNAKGVIRLKLPVPPALLKQAENVLRLYQTPQKSDPSSFDDCGVFGIGLELDERAGGTER